MFKTIATFLKSHILLLIFLVVYFGLSLSFYKDFGPTSDERTERRAAENLQRYLSQSTTYESLVDKNYHDPIDLEIGHHPLTTKYQRFYQYIQSLLNPKGYYEWDHLINLFFGSLFFISSYALFYKLYRSSKIALIPVVFLALTPRLLGDIPGNNKDMPFAVMYLVAVIAIYLFSTKNYSTYAKIIGMGLIFGVMQTFRTIGFSIYFVYLAYHVYLFFIDKVNISREKITNFILELFIIGIFALFISVSIFPWLGSNFFANIYALLLDAKAFQHWDDTILFNGKILLKEDRPWHYIFTWLFITTPIFILALFGSSFVFIRDLIKNKVFTLLCIAILVNSLLYLILQPTIYNGLRHFLFLLPLIVLISSITFIYLYHKFKQPIFRFAIIFLFVLNSSAIIYNYVTLHPYQYLYFNEIVGGLQGANGKFELDYWGTSYKEATEWLVDNRKLTQDNFVYACNNDFSVEYYSDREFFVSFGNYKTADFTICDVEYELKGDFQGEIIHEVKRQGVTLNIIRQKNRTE